MEMDLGFSVCAFLCGGEGGVVDVASFFCRGLVAGVHGLSI